MNNNTPPRVEHVEKISENELEQIFENLKIQHDKYLKNIGVKIPTKFKNGKTNIINKKVLQLCFAFKNIGCIFHKNQVAKFVAFYHEENTDQQVRHLSSQDGWNILNVDEDYQGYRLKSGEHVLISTTIPKKSFMYKKRKKVISDKDFEKLNTEKICLTCKIKEGDIQAATGKVAVIQKGHKDPTKELTPENTMPQCDYCNSVYQDKFVFDDFGRVKSVNSVSYILRHPENFLNDLLIELTKKLISKK